MDNIKPTEINGKLLYAGIAAGINNLLEYQDKLDEINVFPVPDGDTGTNMVFTLMPIKTDCENKITKRADETMQLIAKTALDSAMGNSGTIIAQFFYGINKSFNGLENIYVQDFAKAFEQGYLSAIESLINPEEGTIITVMRDVANKAKEISDNLRSCDKN